MITAAYIGNFAHPWCSEVHIARDLEHLRHTVERMQEPDRQHDPHAFLVWVERWCAEHKPDLLMFTRTWGLPPEATDLWRRLERMGIVTCSYHLDLYVGLQREAGIETDPFWTTGWVWTPDGDPKSDEFFRERGINHHWSSPAVVSDECGPGTWRDEFDYDVVFVGSEGYHTEWPWRPRLIQFLRDKYGPRFKRFGGDVPGGPIRGQDLNDLYATAKVVVGDSLALPGHTNYWTDRYFETIGRGGFLIAPTVPGIEDFLTPGVHFLGYSHPDTVGWNSTEEALWQVGELVDLALSMGDEKRSTIRQAGMDHVRNFHTYKHRLAAALDVMGFAHHDRAVTAATLSSAAIQLPIEKLELGSGFHPTEGFTHLDLNPACNPDIIGSAWPLDLPDESVGEIRAVDVLEHLPYTKSAEIVADWFRVLRPGGRIYIQCPDLQTIMEWFVNEPHRLVDRLPANLPQTPLSGAVWRIFGSMDDGVYLEKGGDVRFNSHLAGFSVRSLRELLEGAGFRIESLTVNIHPNLMCTAVRP